MLELINISKKVGNFSLKNINLHVDTNEYFVLLGQSGSGKSLLLEIISGLLFPDYGKLIFNNIDITKQKTQQRDIRLVFQQNTLFPHKNVFENIAYSLRTTKMTNAEIKQKVNAIAEEMEIAALLHRSTKNLSGGEIQRVALSRSLIANPKCLLLDEPLSSVDVSLRKDLRSALRNINKQGVMIIHVTHDYKETISLAQKVAVIHKGEIIQQGNIHDVFHKPASPFVAKLSGSSNFFPAKLTHEKGKSEKKAIVENQIVINLITEENSGFGHLLVNENDITISLQFPESSASNVFEGKVKEMVTSREGVEVVVDIGIEITAKITTKSLEKLALCEGKIIWISFKATAVRFIPS